ncbi:MAG: hypothetical protein LC795_02935 [Acidobacteria bacterium]|nr:hypothetical protein [Acidobacteriota bacterium]
MRSKLAVVLVAGVALASPVLTSPFAPTPHSAAGAAAQARPAAAKPPQQEPLPGDFEQKVRRRYEQIPEPEVTFEQYLAFEKEEFLRLRQLERDRRLRYQPAAKKNLPGETYNPKGGCGNSDLETAIDATKWHGAYGTVPGTGNPVFSSFTAGITPGNSPGPLNSSSSRHTWVGAGTDPNVGIPLTGPNASGQPSAGAVRIGNAANGAGSELMSKTFVAASTKIGFWYAVVLNISGHPSPIALPSFWVRVADANGNVIPGAANLGNGKDKLLDDDPFLKINPAHTHAYTEWTCAQITLPAAQLGKTVTVQFITEDCVRGQHHAYAYLDNFCAGCPAMPRQTSPAQRSRHERLTGESAPRDGLDGRRPPPRTSRR